jgi:hypothetical protein
VFGAAGLALGVVIGALGAGTFLVTTAAAAGGAAQAHSATLASAVAKCDVADPEYFELGDQGRSLSMKTQGDESDGATVDEVACVLRRLKTPDSVVDEMDATRALDGRQRASWNGLEASWIYHPDDGLQIIVTQTH